MKSGYEVTIKVFVPCDPMQPETMKSALDEIERLKAYVNDGKTDIEIAKTKFVRRRGEDVALPA